MKMFFRGKDMTLLLLTSQYILPHCQDDCKIEMNTFIATVKQIENVTMLHGVFFRSILHFVFCAARETDGRLLFPKCLPVCLGASAVCVHSVCVCVCMCVCVYSMCVGRSLFTSK